MALDNILFPDEMVFTLNRGNGGTVTNMVVTDSDQHMINVPLVQSFIPESNIVF